MNTTHIIITLLGQVFLIGILLPLIIILDDYLDKDYYKLKKGVYVKCSRHEHGAKKLKLYSRILENSNKTKQKGIISRITNIKL